MLCGVKGSWIIQLNENTWNLNEVISGKQNLIFKNYSTEKLPWIMGAVHAFFSVDSVFLQKWAMLSNIRLGAGRQSIKNIIFPQINKKCYEMYPSVSSNWNNLSSEGMLIVLGGVLTDDFCLQMDQNILKQK